MSAEYSRADKHTHLVTAVWGPASLCVCVCIRGMFSFVVSVCVLNGCIDDQPEL